MGIKIKGVQLEKTDTNSVRGVSTIVSRRSNKLDGKLLIELSQGVASGKGELDITSISEKLQDKLYDVLNEIEKELNGAENEVKEVKHPSDITSPSQGDIEKALEELSKNMKITIHGHF